MQRRVLVRTAIALSTAIAIPCLVTQALADTIISASNNATIQPGGPRAGTNGKIFFNMEGSSNGSFSDFGVVDFQTPSGVTFGPSRAFIGADTRQCGLYRQRLIGILRQHRYNDRH